MTAPVITTATVSVGPVVAGVPLSVDVEWVGSPRVEPTYQWRNGTIILRGETGRSYTPASPDEVPNCVIQIDNGDGTATTVALLFVAEEPTPTESLYVESGYVEEGYVE